MPSLHVNGVRVHYSDQGRGDPVILVHTGVSNGGQWRAITGHLAANWRCLAIDLHGRGKSDPWPGPGGVSLDGDAGLVMALAAKHGPAHLVGHSWGAAVGIQAVLAASSSFASLALIEPPLYPLLVERGEVDILAPLEADVERFLGQIDEGRQAEGWQDFVNMHNGAGTWESLSHDKRQEFIAMSDTARDSYDAMHQSPTRGVDLGRLTLPTLVLWGSETAPHDIRLCEIALETIPGSRGEAIPGAGHVSPMSHPEEVAAALRRHLERCSRGRSGPAVV